MRGRNAIGLFLPFLVMSNVLRSEAEEAQSHEDTKMSQCCSSAEANQLASGIFHFAELYDQARRAIPSCTEKNSFFDVSCTFSSNVGKIGKPKRIKLEKFNENELKELIVWERKPEALELVEWEEKLETKDLLAFCVGTILSGLAKSEESFDDDMYDSLSAIRRLSRVSSTTK